MVEQEAIEIPDFRIGEEELTPGVAPLEGGTRIRIIGENFSDESTVTIGNDPATHVMAARHGRLLYATVPAGTAGFKDVIVNTPGQTDKLINSGIRYVSDVVEAARAVLMSTDVHLEEIKERAQALSDAGTFTDIERSKIQIELELALSLTYEAVDQRMFATGTSEPPSTLGEVYDEYIDRQSQLHQDVEEMIG